MTRKENSGVRDLEFSQWIRDSLPDPKTGFVVSDLDFILSNWKTKKMMFVEIKQYGKKMAKWQELLFKSISAMVAIGAKAKGITFYGFHTITFEKANFDDKVYFDTKEITEENLIKLLSMEFNI